MDFTEADAAFWPLYVRKGGNLYSFCPGKATWDQEAVETMRKLIIAAETGTMLEAGGINDQPDWFVEFLSEFLPMYDDQKFYSRAEAILGGSDAKEVKRGSNNR